MKKLLTSQKFIQKTFISIIIVLLLSFSVPVKSQAGIGGMLLDPLFDLVSTIFDVVTGALQVFLLDGNFGVDSGANVFMIHSDEVPPDSEVLAPPDATVIESNKFNADDYNNSIWGTVYAVPNMKYTPDKIFANKIPALDINFISPTDWTQEKDSDGNLIYENGDAMNKRSIASTLHRTIASWYVSLRNLAVVGLMLVLLYVGIRIVISSTAADKSKYKQMLVDWLIALCLLFTLHYIMTFTITIVDEISETISRKRRKQYNFRSIRYKISNRYNGIHTISGTILKFDY